MGMGSHSNYHAAECFLAAVHSSVFTILPCLLVLVPLYDIDYCKITCILVQSLLTVEAYDHVRFIH